MRDEIINWSLRMCAVQLSVQKVDNRHLVRVCPLLSFAFISSLLLAMSSLPNNLLFTVVLCLHFPYPMSMSMFKASHRVFSLKLYRKDPRCCCLLSCIKERGNKYSIGLSLGRSSHSTLNTPLPLREIRTNQVRPLCCSSWL